MFFTCSFWNRVNTWRVLISTFPSVPAKLLCACYYTQKWRCGITHWSIHYYFNQRSCALAKFRHTWSQVFLARFKITSTLMVCIYKCTCTICECALCVIWCVYSKCILLANDQRSPQVITETLSVCWHAWRYILIFTHLSHWVRDAHIFIFSSTAFFSTTQTIHSRVSEKHNTQSPLAEYPGTVNKCRH